MPPKLKRIIFFITGLLAIVLVLLGILLFQQKQGEGILEVDFLDVGQGDSILIKTPSHQEILVDGGPDSSVLNELGQNLPFYDHTIDLVVSTHPDADHITGLIAVLERYEVKRILSTGVACQTSLCDTWQKLISEKNIPVDITWAGQEYSFGEAKLDIIYPLESLAGQKFKNFNDSSMVAKLIYKENSFMLTGDATTTVEQKILKSFSIGQLQSDVLKVGHHGSQYSSSLEFLEAVKPQYAVIQVGKDNKFGHPHLSTLRKLENIGAKILRTDLDGEIKIKSDGQHLEVRTGR